MPIASRNSRVLSRRVYDGGRLNAVANTSSEMKKGTQSSKERAYVHNFDASDVLRIDVGIP